MMRMSVTALMLAVMIGLVVAETEAQGDNRKVAAARGSLFNPGDFPAMPALNVGEDQEVSFDTSALRVSGQTDGRGTIGTTGDGSTEAAVFAFESIQLRAGSKVTVTGSRPLVLVSRGQIVIDTRLDLAGGDGGLQTNRAESAGQPGPGGWAGGMPAKDRGGPADGPGAGFNRRVKGGAAGGGGGFGGAGGESSPSDGGGERMRGGAAYGDPALSALTGGSGGAGGSHDRIASAPSGGGGGGGAVALISLRAIQLGPNAAINVRGGDSPRRPTTGGGGAGGAVVLAAPTVAVDARAVVDASGGNAGQQTSIDRSDGRTNVGTGGGGAGGRIAVYSNQDLGAAGKNQQETRWPDNYRLGGGEGHRNGETGTFFDGAWPNLR
jgi:hypothetical protein